MINFYAFKQIKLLLVSDLPLTKIKAKYGSNFEIITTIKDKTALEIVTQRTLRSLPNYIVEEKFAKIKIVTEESRRKMALAKLGKARDEETKRKISQTMKGKSNFQGKRHSEDSKKKQARAKINNQNTKNMYWAHNPRTDEEKRIKDRNKLPANFILGRDYYSTESGLYAFKISTKSPKGKQPNKDRSFY